MIQCDLGCKFKVVFSHFRSSPQWNNRSLAPYEPKFRSGWVPPEIIGSGRSMPANVGATVAASAAERGDKLKNNANKEVTVYVLYFILTT